jgi:O-antigen/teichoic acid export membrane protein
VTAGTGTGVGRDAADGDAGGVRTTGRWPEPSVPGSAARSAEARGETVDQLLDRNLAELLQELRVAITGVQVLFAFLLGLAFTQRFADLDAFARTVYTVTLLATALATVLLIAPVSFHRLVFRRRLKAALIEVGDRMLRAGLALLVLAITSGVLLVLDVVLGRAAGIVAGAAVLLVATVTWYALPVWARRTSAGGHPDPTGAEDRPAG